MAQSVPFFGHCHSNDPGQVVLHQDFRSYATILLFRAGGPIPRVFPCRIRNLFYGGRDRACLDGRSAHRRYKALGSTTFVDPSIRPKAQHDTSRPSKPCSGLLAKSRRLQLLCLRLWHVGQFRTSRKVLACFWSCERDDHYMITVDYLLHSILVPPGGIFNDKMICRGMSRASRFNPEDDIVESKECCEFLVTMSCSSEHA